MKVFTDQLGRKITVQQPPQRIISLVPSQTELLFDLGLNDRVAGITKFCMHPDEWFRTKTRVGGTKSVNTETIHRLDPDFILANKEENVQQQVEELAEKYPVWISDINNLEDALSMIASVGEITQTEKAAAPILDTIRKSFSEMNYLQPPLTTAYLIWRDPFMSVGHDTFINDMLQRGGMKNVFGELSRYPEVNVAMLKEAKPALVLLSSEPYPFKQKHIAELQDHLPDSKIILVDGEMFSWYGSRLLKTPAYLNDLISRIDGLI